MVKKHNFSAKEIRKMLDVSSKLFFKKPLPKAIKEEKDEILKKKFMDLYNKALKKLQKTSKKVQNGGVILRPTTDGQNPAPPPDCTNNNSEEEEDGSRCFLGPLSYDCLNTNADPAAADGVVVSGEYCYDKRMLCEWIRDKGRGNVRDPQTNQLYSNEYIDGLQCNPPIPAALPEPTAAEIADAMRGWAAGERQLLIIAGQAPNELAAAIIIWKDTPTWDLNYTFLKNEMHRLAGEAGAADYINILRSIGGMDDAASVVVMGVSVGIMARVIAGFDLIREMTVGGGNVGDIDVVFDGGRRKKTRRRKRRRKSRNTKKRRRRRKTRRKRRRKARRKYNA